MRHQPEHARREGREQHASLSPAPPPSARPARRRHVENQDVGLHRRDVELTPATAPSRSASGARWRGPREPLELWSSAKSPAAARTPPGASRRRACGGSDRAARCRPCAGEHGADRAAEPLRQRDAASSKGAASSRSCAGGDRRVEQARAVEIGRHPDFARRGAHRCGSACGKHDAAAAVMRVLDHDQRRRRIDDVARRLEGGAAIRARSKTPLAPTAVSCTPATAAAAGLVPHHVGFAADDHLVAGPGEHLERDLVRHRAAGDEQRRLLAEQRGDRSCSRLTGDPRRTGRRRPAPSAMAGASPPTAG